MAARWNYESLKSEARDRGMKVDELLALSPKNDPFYTGSAGQVEGARWFADCFRQFYGSASGVHLRRIHYRLVSQEGRMLMPSGEPYLNTENCWNYLTSVSKWARYQGLIDADAFVDKRNQEPSLHAYFYSDAQVDPSYSVQSEWSDGIDALAVPDLPGLPDLPQLPDLPALIGAGYDLEQPYLVEIWVEKTTMNDVLLPLCRRYNCNLVTGAGELSITAVRNFLKRAAEAGRPARILYISDFDPAGLGMPISIARKIEFYQRSEAEFEDLDIALYPVVLTESQVRSFNLPRVPVKDSDLRKARFEAGHGEGQVELDALEALYPGRLAEIVRGEILRFYDRNLWSKKNEAKEKLQAALSAEAQAQLDDRSWDWQQLREAEAAVRSDYEALQREFAELVATFAPRFDAVRVQLADLRSQARDAYSDLEGALQSVVDRQDIDLDEFPVPDYETGDAPEAVLYESTRDYFDQLAAYAAQRDGAGAEVE